MTPQQICEDIVKNDREHPEEEDVPLWAVVGLIALLFTGTLLMCICQVLVS